MYHYCMNLIGWKKEDKVISFLKNFNQPSEVKSLLLGLSNYNLSNFETAKICGSGGSVICGRIVKLVLGDVGFELLEKVLSEENEKREKCEATISRWIWESEC